MCAFDDDDANYKSPIEKLNLKADCAKYEYVN